MKTLVWQVKPRSPGARHPAQDERSFLHMTDAEGQQDIEGTRGQGIFISETWEAIGYTPQCDREILRHALRMIEWPPADLGAIVIPFPRRGAA